MPKSKRKARKRTSTSYKNVAKILGYSISHRTVLVFSVLFIALVVSANISVTRALSPSVSQNVLGEEDKQEEGKKEEQKSEENKKQEEQKQEEVKKLIQNAPIRIFSKPTITKTKTENVSSAGLKAKTKSEDNKRETEIETLDGQKIKTKIEDDGTTKIEVENGSVKLKYVAENGIMVLKAENESGKEINLAENDLDELEDSLSDELENEGIDISTASGKTTFSKNSIAASTNFPLSIDVVTKQLVVATPQGQKIVTVLPDVAVSNLLRTGIVNMIDSSTDTGTSSDLGTLDGVVRLTVRDNESVYEVKGAKKQKLFGVIPVSTPKTVFVSTKTGEPIAQEESLLSNIIDRLSP